MFSYSERDATYAARRIPDDVSPQIKKRRLREIVALQETISAEVNAAHVGRRERVLIHSRSRRSADEMFGRTDGFKGVVLPGNGAAPGDLVDVVIERTTLATLFGRPA